MLGTVRRVEEQEFEGIGRRRPPLRHKLPMAVIVGLFVVGAVADWAGQGLVRSVAFIGAFAVAMVCSARLEIDLPRDWPMVLVVLASVLVLAYQVILGVAA